MNRFELRVNDHVQGRLNALMNMTGMERNQILLAAFAQYMPDVQPVAEKVAPKRSTVEKSLGEGNKPKNVKEVEAYFRKKGLPEPISEKANLFYDYYQSNGWKVGKNPVKQWGSCLTTWLKNNPDWRPVPSTKKDTIQLGDFLDWAEKERPPLFSKYRTAKSIQDIDQLYIEEYADNNQ